MYYQLQRRWFQMYNIVYYSLFIIHIVFIVFSNLNSVIITFKTITKKKKKYLPSVMNNDKKYVDTHAYCQPKRV